MTRCVIDVLTEMELKIPQATQAHGCLSGQQSRLLIRSIGLQLPSTLLVLLHNWGFIPDGITESG